MGYVVKSRDAVLISHWAATPEGIERVNAALSRLDLAAKLIEASGRGLAPYVALASSEGLVELSTELCNIREILAQGLRKQGRVVPFG